VEARKGLMGASPAVLVLDLGLSNCKANVFTMDGQSLGRSTVAYATYHPQRGYAEQDPEEWWGAVCQATARLWEADPGLAGRIESISVTGHMHALVPLDGRNQPLSRAIVLGDQRSVDSARQIVAELGLKIIYHITGARMEESMPAARIHWLKTHVADIFHATQLFTGCKDYVRGRMTGGDRFTDPIDACATSLYDLRDGTWSPDLMRVSGITPDRLPEISPPASLAGELQPGAARSLGLRDGIPVVVGSGDDVEVLGAGLVTAGRSIEHFGTTGSFLTCTDELVYDPEMALEVYPHVDPNLWVVGGSITSAGAALAWAADVLGYQDVEGFLAASAHSLSDSPGYPLVFVPHLSGERCPNWNPQVRGSWLGLSNDHTRMDLMRAAFEGTAHALNSILKRIVSLAGEQSAVYVVYRQGDSADWLQLRANTYGKPLHVLDSTGPTALGAMILGAVGIGAYPSIHEAVDAVVGVVRSIEPDPASRDLLVHQSALYEQTQAALAPIWSAIHDLSTFQLASLSAANPVSGGEYHA
jgi:xylulokinase